MDLSFWGALGFPSDLTYRTVDAFIELGGWPRMMSLCVWEPESGVGCVTLSVEEGGG